MNEEMPMLCHPDTLMLDYKERKQYIDAILRIAETAIANNFGKLAVSDLEIVNSLNDKNDALLEEWLAR